MRTARLALALTPLALAAILCSASPAAARDAYMLSTGAKDGTYARVGEVIREAVRGDADHGEIDLAVVPSAGSVVNVRRLSRGDADFAIVQGDVLFFACRGKGSFPQAVRGLRAVATLYPETLHVIARVGAGVTTINDLRGKRVSVGEKGSGTAATAAEVLRGHGLGSDDATIVHFALTDAIAKLRAGELDALFATTAAPAPNLRELCAAGEGALVSVDAARASAIASAIPYLSPQELPAGTYPGQTSPVTALVTHAALVTRESLPADVVHELLERLSGAKDALQAVLPSGLEALPAHTVDQLPVPLHAGSMTYYKTEGAITRPIRVFSSIFLHDIYAFDMTEGTYEAAFDVWFKWKGRIDAENEDFEFKLLNGTVNEMEKVATEKHADLTRVVYRVDATMRGNFLLHDYPFDRQVVTIDLEHRHLPQEDLQLIPDTKRGEAARDLVAEAIEPRMAISDWLLTDVRQETHEHLYPSDFGSIGDAGSQMSFSQYRFEVELRRLVLSYLLKFFIPLIMIGCMTWSVFFIDPEAYETKILVVIWDLFIAAEYHAYQGEHLPEIGYLVTADHFFLLSYVAIFVALIHTITLDHYERQKNHKVVRAMTLIGRIAFPFIFFAPIVGLIVSKL